MSEPVDETAQARALWRQFVAASGAAGTGPEASPPELDALTLAAYAEGRLPDAERQAVAELLAEYPELAEDVALAQRSANLADVSSEDLSRVTMRASALVPASDDRVIAFRPRPRGAAPGWRDAARWSALAASFLVVAYLGFSLGSGTSLVLAGLDQPVAGATDELFDPPTGLFGGPADASGT